MPVLYSDVVGAPPGVEAETGARRVSLEELLRTATTGVVTVDQYRAKWALPSTYPMVAPNYAETRSNLAKKMGLGRSRTAPPPPPKKPGRKAGAKKAAR
jgi:predicted transcriptional regulator